MRRFLLSLAFILIALFVVIMATYSVAYYGTFNIEAMGIATELIFGNLPNLFGFLLRLALFVVFIVLCIKAFREERTLLMIGLFLFGMWFVSQYGFFGWIALPDKGFGLLGLWLITGIIVTAIVSLIMAPRAPRMERHTHEEHAAHVAHPSLNSRIRARVARWAQDDDNTTTAVAHPAPQPTTTQPTIPSTRQSHE